MIFTGILAAGVVWCLFYNYISNAALLLLSICAAGLFLWAGHVKEPVSYTHLTLPTKRRV